jgi:UDP-N-acetylmuramyl tripeptide synthase
MEVARGGILREGLGYDRNDIAVVTNVAPDHLGMKGHRHAGAARRREGGRRGSGAAQRFCRC